MQKEISCRKAAIFCFKKQIETNSLVIRYNSDSSSPHYTSIAADIDTAKDNKEMFNECLAMFGLKFEKIGNEFSTYYTYEELHLSKL